jgi:hypothetical protein
VSGNQPFPCHFCICELLPHVLGFGFGVVEDSLFLSEFVLVFEAMAQYFLFVHLVCFPDLLFEYFHLFLEYLFLF